MTRSTTDANVRSALIAAVAFAALVMLLGLFAAPERIWRAWLVAELALVGLAIGGPVFIGITRLSAARWSRPIESVPFAMARALPLAAALAALVILGSSSLFSWTSEEVLQHEPHVAAKSGWLNMPFFILRTVIVLTFWLWAAPRLKQRTGRGFAGLFMIGFALTFSIFSIDWVMSLEPTWFSTMWGVYNFAGLLLSTLAVITMLAIRARRRGELPGLDDEKLRDLGKLIFAFCFFWGYIWYCQYMLIWYTNIPEETSWFASRLSGGWATLCLVNLLVNFLVPFLVLLPAPAKKRERTLMRVCGLLVFGRWLDLYLMTTPSGPFSEPPLSIWEIAPFIGAMAAFFLLATRAPLGRKDEAGSPALDEAVATD